MIISKIPLRITLGGGGTDLKSYYSRYGGLVLSAAINKYVYVSMNRLLLEKHIKVIDKSIEYVNRREEISNPLLRMALERYNVNEAMEIISSSDIPDGTGLGS